MKKFALFSLAAAITIPMVSGVAMAGGEAMSGGEAMAEGEAVPAAEVVVDPKAAKRGKKVAVRQCVACHDITEAKQNKVGPPLWGMFGKPAASAEGYAYSDVHMAKKDSITWDEATLDAYLENPMAVIPGNKMIYPGVKKEKQRKNLIEYMKTLK